MPILKVILSTPLLYTLACLAAVPIAQADEPAPPKEARFMPSFQLNSRVDPQKSTNVVGTLGPSVRFEYRRIANDQADSSKRSPVVYDNLDVSLGISRGQETSLTL